jgi:hypothetical protein
MLRNLMIAMALFVFVLGGPGEAATARYGADLPARFTLSVIINEVEPCPNGETTTGTEVVTISVQDDIAVLKSQFFYETLPTYKRPDGGDFQLINYDERGNYLVWRQSETLRMSTPQGDQALKLFRLLRVSPDGKVVAEPSTHTQLLKSASSTSSGVSDFDLIVMALGQGFSRYLASNAQSSSGGVQKTQIAGGLGAKDGGVWDLTYAQEDGRLVRQANFKGKQGYSVLGVKTAGAERVGDAVIARQGEALLGDVTESYGISVELESFSDTSDPALLEQVRARFAQGLVKGNEILDMTTEVISREFVADPVPVPVEGCCVCRAVNRTFSECGHLQASVRCASDWCITNVMTSATCANVAPTGASNCRIVSPIPPQPEVIQTPRLLPNGGCPTAGNPVNYATLFTTYDGCSGCTPTAGTNHRTACDVENCPAGTSLDRCAAPRGIRRACS